MSQTSPTPKSLRSPRSPDWHGWSRGRANLYVGHLPGRKQVAVYTIDRHPWTDDEGVHQMGSSIRVLAWCPDEEGAIDLVNEMDSLINARDRPGAR